VILLDEIEKAHPDVHNVLLQVFDDGRLTDGKGRVVDFTNTLIIATSNIGAEIIARRLRQVGGDTSDPAKVREELMDTLRMHFRPEFINRLDEVIVFHSLTREQIKQIVELHLERVRRTAHAQGVELEVDASLVDYLALEGYRPEYGARELKRLIRSTLETELARAMLADEVHDGDRVRARWDAATRRLVLEPARPGADTQGARPRRKAAKPNGAPADEPAPPPDSRPAPDHPQPAA
jgi:ATP-dependent Clp protease ATP-binding subunit ClpC